MALKKLKTKNTYFLITTYIWLVSSTFTSFTLLALGSDSLFIVVSERTITILSIACNRPLKILHKLVLIMVLAFSSCRFFSFRSTVLIFGNVGIAFSVGAGRWFFWMKFVQICAWIIVFRRLGFFLQVSILQTFHGVHAQVVSNIANKLDLFCNRWVFIIDFVARLKF